MSGVRVSALLRLAALLSLGSFVGAYFDAWLIGLLIAALVALGYQVFMLLRLESELRLGRPISVPEGTGLWARTLARIDYLGQRIARHKKRNRALLKEIRNSVNALPDGTVLLDDEDEILRFNKQAPELLAQPGPGPTLGEYLRERGYSQRFVDHYILPMGASIWSSQPP